MLYEIFNKQCPGAGSQRRFGHVPGRSTISTPTKRKMLEVTDMKEDKTAKNPHLDPASPVLRHRANTLSSPTLSQSRNRVQVRRRRTKSIRSTTLPGQLLLTKMWKDKDSEDWD